MLSLYQPSSSIPGNEAERRIFYHLRERAIHDISGYFQSDFWDRLVLQISHSEPTVRHALLALSSLCESSYEEEEVTDVHSTSVPPPVSSVNAQRAHFALGQYNKAVRLLAERLSSAQLSLDVTLTACLVFIWLEFMRNDFDAALCHLKSGLKILKDFRSGDEGLALRTQRVDVSLIQLFARLETQATVHGSPTSDFCASFSTASSPHSSLVETITIPPTFTSIDQACNTLNTLLSSIFHFVRNCHDDTFIEATGPLELQARCTSYLHSLSLWQAAQQKSPAHTFKSLPDTRQTAAVALLNLQHSCVTILLETLFTPSQMIYDAYDDSFTQMLYLADKLLLHQHHCSTSSSTSVPASPRKIIFFDMGVIAPLFFVILKCRTLTLRRRALNLLRRSPRREGMWHRRSVVRYAEWKVGIEEARGRALLGGREEARLPEEARVWCEKLREVVVEGDGGGERRTEVSFWWRGKDGEVYMGWDVTDVDLRMGQMI